MIDLIKKSLLTIVSSERNGQGDLISALKQLDNILEEHEAEMHPGLRLLGKKKGYEMDARLRHFLQNRSYEKALLWIEGETPQKGICQK